MREKFMKNFCLILSVLLTFPLYPISADILVWTDDFDRNRLSDGWRFRDRQGSPPSIFDLRNGWLQITSQGPLGHTVPDKPIMEREVSRGAGQNITVTGIFSCEPQPRDTYMGLFLFGDSNLEYSCLTFGGEAVQTADGIHIHAGSSIITWGPPKNDRHGTYRHGIEYIQSTNQGTDIEMPGTSIHLRVIKEGSRLLPYYRSDANEDWIFLRSSTISGRSWEHDFEVARIGVGFHNNWSGWTFTFRVDTLSIEHEATENLENPTLQWCRLKVDE